MKTEIGPDREQVELAAVEIDAFTLLVESHTRPQERHDLSYALRQVRYVQSISVIEAFHRNARRIWRPHRAAGSTP